LSAIRGIYKELDGMQERMSLVMLDGSHGVLSLCSFVIGGATFMDGKLAGARAGSRLTGRSATIGCPRAQLTRNVTIIDDFAIIFDSQIFLGLHHLNELASFDRPRSGSTCRAVLGPRPPEVDSRCHADRQSATDGWTDIV
jgi:hypothetical protein